MKSPLIIIGILLIIGGVLAGSYQTITYQKNEKVAEIGSLKITNDTDKTIYIPPIVSGLTIAAGLILLVIGRKR